MLMGIRKLGIARRGRMGGLNGLNSSLVWCDRDLDRSNCRIYIWDVCLNGNVEVREGICFGGWVFVERLGKLVMQRSCGQLYTTH